MRVECLRMSWSVDDNFTQRIVTRNLGNKKARALLSINKIHRHKHFPRRGNRQKKEMHLEEMQRGHCPQDTVDQSQMTDQELVQVGIQYTHVLNLMLILASDP